MDNPLLTYKNDTNGSFIRFDLIKDEHFEPAFEIALATAKENLKKLIDNPKAPTFENTIEAIEYVDEDLERIQFIFLNLKDANTSKELERVANVILPKISDFGNDLLLNKKLFEKVKFVFDSKPKLLTKEQYRLLDTIYKGFVRTGALLDKEDKQKLRDHDKSLILLSQKFDENLLGATNAYELHILEEKDLFGLPERVVEMAKVEAKERGKEGWVFTLKEPSAAPFVQYAENAELRKQISVASSKRGMEEPFDNRQIVLDIIKIRRERAQLLGYKSHADFVLENRMAQKQDTVESFLNNIAKIAKPFAQKDFEMIKEYKYKLTKNKEFNPWDLAFYEEKFKKEYFDFDEEETRPYFEVNNVLEGVFQHAKLLYGIIAKERKDIPVYHADVKVFEFKKNTGEDVGLLYLDLYPRDSKRQGGWIETLRVQNKKNEQRASPHLLIVCNVTKPTETTPALITSYEAEVIFHEFGHALSVLLCDCQYASLSGLMTLLDFVELPSQIMQSWLTQKESLKLFAKHYQTGETLPDLEIEKILRADRFMVGWSAVAQASASLLDLAWHSTKSVDVTDIEKFETQIRGPFRFFLPYEGTSLTTSFKHIFSSGYDVGYYSYAWSEVLAVDAFEYFKEKGLFSKEIAEKFRANILSKGNTEEPLELYRRFRGRDADPKALFRHKGLIE